MSFLTLGGKPLFLAGKLALSQIDGGAVIPPTPGGSLPTDSLTGWWDASARPIGAAWAFPGAGSTTKSLTLAVGGPVIAGRTAGLLPGFYDSGVMAQTQWRYPRINDYTATATSMAAGTGQSLTVFLVWTRSNLRQVNAALDKSPVSLLHVGGVEILRMEGAGAGADTLTLLPASLALTAGSVPLRHTRGVIVQFSAGQVSVWLDDGTALFSGVTSGVDLSAARDVAFVKNAQLIFHEAAIWNKAHSSAERTQVLSYMARWPMGQRRAANFFTTGQSNALLFGASYTLFPRLSAAIAYLTGCPTANPLWTGNVSGETFNAGQGLYNGTANWFLDNSGGGDPSTWPLGTNGTKFMAAVDSASQDDRDNTFAIWEFWSETDSQMLTTAKKAEFFAAKKREYSLIRAKFNRTAAQLPIMVVNAIPYLTTEGCQIHREVMQDLVNDPAQNVLFMLAQSTDANGQADDWNPATGDETGPGDGGHRNLLGMLTYQRRMVYSMTKAILAAQVACGRPDAVTAYNAALPATGGPKITAAQYEGGTSVLVTVAHDGGSDLLLPLKAVQGVGWALMDGVSGTTAGTPGAPGVLIKATACARVSATQLRLTLASAPTYPGKAKLYYPYGMGYDAVTGYAVIGQGNAVTDNFAAAVLPTAWKIGADLGAAEQPNMPVQATTYGVALA